MTAHAATLELTLPPTPPSPPLPFAKAVEAVMRTFALEQPTAFDKIAEAIRDGRAAIYFDGVSSAGPQEMRPASLGRGREVLDRTAGQWRDVAAGLVHLEAAHAAVAATWPQRDGYSPPSAAMLADRSAWAPLRAAVRDMVDHDWPDALRRLPARVIVHAGCALAALHRIPIAERLPSGALEALELAPGEMMADAQCFDGPSALGSSAELPLALISDGRVNSNGKLRITRQVEAAHVHVPTMRDQLMAVVTGTRPRSSHGWGAALEGLWS
jgi:hypothetical protein